MVKVIEVADLEEDFEVFDRPYPIEPLPSTQISSSQGPPDIPEAMVLHRKKNTSLLELLESHVGGSTPEVAIQPRPPTPLPTHSSSFEQLEKKRKRKKKRK